MPSSVASHSHRSTTKASHKPFKSRKATKGALKEIQKGNILFFRNASITISNSYRQSTGSEPSQIPPPATHVQVRSQKSSPTEATSKTQGALKRKQRVCRTRWCPEDR